MQSESKDNWSKAIFGAGAVPMGWSLGLLTGVLLAQVFLGPLREKTGETDVARYRRVRDFAREAFVREVSDAELRDAALDGMLASLDGYSRYYDVQQSVTLDRETSGRLEGVGAIFRHLDGDWRVIFPAENSPAARAGLQVGDTVRMLDGVAIRDFDGQVFREHLVPEDADSVVANVLHLDGTVEDLTIHPSIVVDPSVRHVRLIPSAPAVGYVSIQSFSRETDEEFDRAVTFLRDRGATSLIIDLRGNLGGVLDSAVEIARRFVPEGVIVSTEGRGEPLIEYANADVATMTDLNVVLLVDDLSASASEVLAACLQDHRRALLVGTRTYGKGVVQSIRRFSSPDARAKVTSAYYYAPSHRNFERTAHVGSEPGLVPDVQVGLSLQERFDAHTFLTAYAPPADQVENILAWEQLEDRSILDPLPLDAQLLTAVAMLGGPLPE